VSDGPGNPETVGESGVVVPVGDPKALADVLARLAADDTERRRLGEAARARYESHHSLERFQRRMAEIYSELLGVRIDVPA
jgi:glycosyltransferase involved in cell wall biosynthesis